MKPLPVAPLTDEDWAILVSHRGDFRRAYLMGWLLGHGRESDRRDAELIFGYEDAKASYIAQAGVFAYWRARALGVELARKAM